MNRFINVFKGVVWFLTNRTFWKYFFEELFKIMGNRGK